jgi:L-alanine-DL-glutamate epimerase-like enolase superfamily enzyme
VELTAGRIERGTDGRLRVPEGPGLGIAPDPATVRRYLVDTELRVGGRVLYRTPAWP